MVIDPKERSIADAGDERGQAHHGVVLVDPANLPRGQQRTMGRLVTQLDRLLKDQPGDEATSILCWL